MLLVFTISCNNNYDKLETLINNKEFTAAQSIIDKNISEILRKPKLDSQALYNYYFYNAYSTFKQYNYTKSLVLVQQLKPFSAKFINKNHELNILQILAFCNKRLHFTDSTKYYFNLLVNYAKQHNDMGLYANSLFLLANTMEHNSNPLEIEYFNKASNICNTGNYPEANGRRFFTFAFFSLGKLDYDSTIYYYKKAIIEFKKANINDEVSRCQNNIGEVYRYQKNYNVALQYYIESYETALKDKNPFRLYVTCVNIADIKLYLNDYAGAKEFYLKSIEYGKVNNDTITQILEINSLGIIANIDKNYEQAIKYYLQSIEMANKFNLAKESIPKSYEDIAKLSIKLGKTAFAKSILDTLVNLNITVDEDNRKIEIDSRAAILYCQIGEFKIAEKLISNSYYDAINNNNLKQLRDAAYVNYLINQHKSNFKLALFYLQKYDGTNTLILENEKNIEVGKKQILIENKEAQVNQENKLQKLNNNLNDKTKTRNYFIISTVIFLLFTAITYYLFKKFNKKRTELKIKNEIILKLNEELSVNNKNLENLAELTAQDIIGPLRTITNILKIIYKKYENILQTNDANAYADIINGNNELVEMLTGILNFSTLTKNLSESKIIDLNYIVNTILDKIQQQTAKDEFDVITKFNPEFIEGHSFLYTQLFYNLIANAIKYKKKNTKLLLTIEMYAQNNFYHFKVVDNGIGIAKQYHASIFELFNKIHNQNEYSGYGIGLSTCKKIVTFYKGNIWLQSEENVGTTINFTISY